VRFKIDATGDGDVTFTATDEAVTYTFTNSGYWGPAAGFDLPPDYTATTDWTLNFSEVGKYTIIFSLIEAPDGEVVAGITETVEVTVVSPPTPPAPSGGPVGGEVYPVNKTGVLAPWIGLAGAIVAAAYILRKRHAAHRASIDQS